MSDELYRMLTGGEKPGFSGKDKMRENAERMFGDEMKASKMHVPSSNTSPGNSKMRMYKKGGSVNHGEHHSRSKHHGLNHDQKDLHLPHRKAEKMHRQEKMSKVEHKGWGGMLGNGLDMAQGMMGRTPPGMALGMGRGILGFKKGGKAHHKKHCHATGGAIDDEQNMNAMKPTQSLKVNPALRRGGKVHHKRERVEHRMDGGLIGQARNALNQGYGQVKNLASQGQDYMNQGMGKLNGYMNQGANAARGFLGLKHGGKVNHRAKGGCMSEGGPMRGEHPSHHLSRNNYESDMVGEKRGKKSYANGGTMGNGRGFRTGIEIPHFPHESRFFSEGGKAKMSDGGMMRYAAGGAGKVRHGQATKSGAQKTPRFHPKRGGSC